MFYAFGIVFDRPDPAQPDAGGAPVALTPMALDALPYLVDPGRIVSKDELLGALWPRRVVSGKL